MKKWIIDGKTVTVFHGDKNFKGGAEQFWGELTERIIPQVESEIADSISWCGIVCNLCTL